MTASRKSIEDLIKAAESVRSQIQHLGMGEIEGQLQAASRAAAASLSLKPEDFERFSQAAKSTLESINRTSDALSALASNVDINAAMRALEQLSANAATLRALNSAAEAFAHYSQQLERLERLSGGPTFTRSGDHVSVEAAESLKVGENVSAELERASK